MFKILIFLSFFISFQSYALSNSNTELNEFYNSVVWLKSDAPDATGDTTTAFCNATLLSKNMAITAAHCAHLPYVSGVRKMTIEKGEYLFKKRPDGTIARIGYAPKFSKEVHIEIEFSPNLKDKMDKSGFKAKIGPSEDVAIIWWKDDTEVFSQLSYPEIVSPKDFSKIIKSIASYNLTVTTINPFSEVTTLDTRRSAVLNNVKWTFSNYIESKSLSRVDAGDSGSPLFIDNNGNKNIFGVVKGKAQTVFDNWDAFSAVTTISCEIDKHLPSDMRIKNCN